MATGGRGFNLLGCHPHNSILHCMGCPAIPQTLPKSQMCERTYPRKVHSRHFSRRNRLAVGLKLGRHSLCKGNKLLILRAMYRALGPEILYKCQKFCTGAVGTVACAGRLWCWPQHAGRAHEPPCWPGAPGWALPQRQGRGCGSQTVSGACRKGGTGGPCRGESHGSGRGKPCG